MTENPSIDVRKQKRQSDKAAKNAAKEKRLQDEARNKEKLKALMCSRKGLRLDIPPYDGSGEANKDYQPLKGFSLLDKNAVYKEVYQEIRDAKKITDIFNNLKRIFGCRKTEFVVVGFKNHTRHGEIYQRMTLFCKHNNAIPGNFSRLEFDKDRKLWMMESETGTISDFAKPLGRLFKYVIDVNTMSVFVNDKEITCPHKLVTAFNPMAFNIDVNLWCVIESIKNRRKNDDVFSNLSIHNGEKFERLKVFDGNINTNSPFLIFRYRSKGCATYVMVSSIGGSVGEVFWSSDMYDWAYASKYVARYMETCESGNIFIRIQNLNAVSDTVDKLRVMNDDFREFNHEIEAMKSLFPDIQFSLLFLDYSFLPDIDKPIDEAGIGIFSHIPKPNCLLNLDIEDYLRDIACSFGYDKTCYPVVFIRETLLGWSDKHAYFINALAHELSHSIILEHKLSDDATQHSPIWRSIYNIIRYIVFAYADSIDKHGVNESAIKNDITLSDYKPVDEIGRKAILSTLQRLGFFPLDELIALSKKMITMDALIKENLSD